MACGKPGKIRHRRPRSEVSSQGLRPMRVSIRGRTEPAIAVDRSADRTGRAARRLDRQSML